jgi:hypothetical protein
VVEGAEASVPVLELPDQAFSMPDQEFHAPIAPLDDTDPGTITRARPEVGA